MILADHKCAACDHTYEVLVRNGTPDLKTCPACGCTEYTKPMTIARPIGLAKGTDIVVSQTGDKFESYKEMDRVLAARGQRMSTDEENRKYRDASREAADAYARSQGHADKEALRKFLKDKKRVNESVAAAREKQINAHHDKYGNEGRQNVDTKGAFNDKAGTTSLKA